ncbi:MAG: tetratricopeptide repeat protein, partial [Acidobacteriaceae bacterium]|nr:tetratricopeptide repeat protein [Acidobacteriaceae bacterium]
MSFLLTGAITSAYKSQRISRGRAHYEEAERLMHEDRAADAVQEYRKALLFLPENTQYRLSLALALIDTGRLDEAESHLDQLLAEDPT